MRRFATFVMLAALVGFVGCGAPADIDPPTDGGEVNTLEAPGNSDASDTPDATEPSTPDSSGPPTNFTPDEE